MKPKTCKSPLDDVEEIGRIDKSNMLSFSVQASKHYHKAAEISEKIVVNYPKPDNVIIVGMGGSAIGGELLKDYARSQAPVPIEVSKDYTLPAYATAKPSCWSSATQETQRNHSAHSSTPRKGNAWST